MKIKKELLRSITQGTTYGKVIACAIYMSHMLKSGKEDDPMTTNERIAQLFCMGIDIPKIGELLDLTQAKVEEAIRDIENYVYRG